MSAAATGMEDYERQVFIAELAEIQLAVDRAFAYAHGTAPEFLTHHGEVMHELLAIGLDQQEAAVTAGYLTRYVPNWAAGMFPDRVEWAPNAYEAVGEAWSHLLGWALPA